MHTTDSANGASSGIANVIWTSPFDGVVRISGGVWNGRNIGRSNTWRIQVNGRVTASGTILSNDGHSRANPFMFSAGRGGAAFANGITVRRGSVIELDLMSTGTYGDFVGASLTINPVSIKR